MDVLKTGGTRLCPLALGCALGFTWGLAVLILGVLAKTYQFGVAWVHILGSIYIGYAPTFKGIAMGTGWAFAEAFICGFVVAVIYNVCVKHCPCKMCK